MATHQFLVRFALAESGWEKAKKLEDEEKAYILEAYKTGAAVSVGRFADPAKGALGFFATQDAAEAFIRSDPFVRGGVVTSYEIHEFNEVAARPRS